MSASELSANPRLSYNVRPDPALFLQFTLTMLLDRRDHRAPELEG